MPRSLANDPLVVHIRDLQAHEETEAMGEWMAGALYEYSTKVETVAVEPDPILVDYEGAARLLKTTVNALKTRVSRGDNKLAAAMVTNGRSVRFSVAKLTERFTPRGRP